MCLLQFGHFDVKSLNVLNQVLRKFSKILVDGLVGDPIVFLDM